MSQIPLILVVDDDFGSETEGRRRDRRQQCARWNVRDVTASAEPLAEADAGVVADVVFCSGQRMLADGSFENDAGIVLDVVRKHWGPNCERRWALILLDRNFRLSDTRDDIAFGYKILDALVKEWPDPHAAPGNCEIPVLMLTAHGFSENGAEANPRGARGYVEKANLDDENDLQGVLDQHGLMEDREGHAWGRAVGFLKALRDARCAALNGSANVLVLGPTGAGKSHLAHYLHRYTGRAEPLQSLALASQADSAVLRSQIFGYWKGAFTGADSHRAGICEAAHAATLFLDEVGNLDPNGQRELLDYAGHDNGSRIRRFKRMGRFPATPAAENRRAKATIVSGAAFDERTEQITVDVFLVTATNVGLEDEQVRESSGFRDDLYHRLKSGTLIRMPGLNERPEDIAPLFRQFLDAATANLKGREKTLIADEVTEVLRAYNWPGNFRDLTRLASAVADATRDFDSVYRRNLPRWILPTAEGARPGATVAAAVPPATPEMAPVTPPPPAEPQTLDDIIDLSQAFLDGFEKRFVPREEIEGKLASLIEIQGKLMLAMTKAALRATADPGTGQKRITPAVKLLLNETGFTTSQCYDWLKRMVKQYGMQEEALADDELSIVYQEALDHRNSKKSIGAKRKIHDRSG